MDRLRAVGSADDYADVVFDAAARSFFTRVLDALGAQLDVQTAGTFPPDSPSDDRGTFDRPELTDDSGTTADR